MHDPDVVAFEIRLPFPRNQWGFRPSFITIWHHDPERDGTDDSCGWFKRARHGDQAVLKAIRGDFEFNWDASYGGWFGADGKPLMSTPGIVLDMFQHAAFHHFGKNRRRAHRFLRRRLVDILHFAENPIDSMHPSITCKYGVERRDDRIASAASIVYGCVLRWTQPWYRHPRWHFWHWHFQIHPWQSFKRRFIDRCDTCGKRFKGETPHSVGWGATKRHHAACLGIAPASGVKDSAQSEGIPA